MLFGQLTAPYLFRNLPEKLIVSVSLGMIVVSLFIMLFSQLYFLTAFFRLITGFFQVLLSVFVTSWINIFSTHNNR